MKTLTSFTAVDGTKHRIGYVTARDGGARLLCDEWGTRGLRLLCSMKAGEDGGSQMDAVIREYRVDAATTDRPLSRRVEAKEISQTRANSYAVAG